MLDRRVFWDDSLDVLNACIALLPPMDDMEGSFAPFRVASHRWKVRERGREREREREMEREEGRQRQRAREKERETSTIDNELYKQWITNYTP